MLDNGIIDCQCADRVFRFPSDGKLCKHIVAALNLQLLTAPESTAVDAETPF
jgi:hypothetical protein